MADHHHAPHCDCDHHQHHQPRPNAGLLSALPSVLACAVCPACLSAYAKIFAALGVGFSLSEAQHTRLLVVAVGSSLLVSGWRSWRSKKWWPVVVSAFGCALVAAGHVVEVAPVEWAGVLVLLVGGLSEQPLVRRLLARLQPRSASVASH